MRGTALIGLLIAITTTTACQRPTPAADTPPEGSPDAEQSGWSDAQRRAFRATLRTAREDLYRQLRRVRVGPKDRLERLVRDAATSAGELRRLAATAKIRRVRWLPDGRCRLTISLGLIDVVQALDQCDRKDKWAPHRQVFQLNASRTLVATAESQ